MTAVAVPSPYSPAATRPRVSSPLAASAQPRPLPARTHSSCELFSVLPKPAWLHPFTRLANVISQGGWEDWAASATRLSPKDCWDLGL